MPIGSSSHLKRSLHPFKDHILNQNREYGYDIINDQLQNKIIVSKDNKKRNQEESDKIYQQLPYKLQKGVDLAKTKGAST